MGMDHKLVFQKLGILGGGQLGRMLLAPAAQLGVSCAVLDADPEAPCAPFCGDFQVGSLLDYETVLDFGRRCDGVTIEIENVNTEALVQLQSEGISVFPDPQTIRLIQDKGLQKQFLVDHGFPTAPFYLVNSRDELGKHAAFLPFVVKLRRAGYDGRGVQMMQTPLDFEHGFEAPSVVEQRADLAGEMSVLVARSLAGEVVVYRPVVMMMNPSTYMLDGLSTVLGEYEQYVDEIMRLAHDVAEALDLVGILAIEFFINREGSVWINELSPRPHNSGHYTIEGCMTSQYAQHLRSIMGLPLGGVELVYPAVGMLNLVGPSAAHADVFWKALPEWLRLDGVFVHDYGKRSTRPGRKLGHITVVAQTEDELVSKLSEIQGRILR